MTVGPTLTVDFVRSRNADERALIDLIYRVDDIRVLTHRESNAQHLLFLLGVTALRIKNRARTVDIVDDNLVEFKILIGDDISTERLRLTEEYAVYHRRTDECGDYTEQGYDEITDSEDTENDYRGVDSEDDDRAL
jgi:hypothetical protein